MRRRSKTNSNKHKAPDILGEFAAMFPFDMLTPHLNAIRLDGEPCPLWKKFREDNEHMPKSLSIHHIWHLKRADAWGNLIRTSEMAHKFCHKYPVPGYIIAMWARLQYGDDKWEVLEDWHAGSGQDIRGWIQKQRDWGNVPEQYMDAAHDILEGFSCT